MDLYGNPPFQSLSYMEQKVLTTMFTVPVILLHSGKYRYSYTSFLTSSDTESNLGAQQL